MPEDSIIARVGSKIIIRYYLVVSTQQIFTVHIQIIGILANVGGPN